MGIMAANQPKKKSNGEKIKDLRRKMDQLRAAGMLSAAGRLEQQLRQYSEVESIKVKPMTGQEMKKQMQAAKATGQMKA